MKKYFLLTILLNSITIYAQSIQRQTINAFGNTSQNQNLLLLQTVGQSSLTEVWDNDKVILRQGFQQPIVLSGSLQSEIEIFLFPNPNNGVFTFETNLDRNEIFQFEIFDATGRRVLSQTANAGGQTTVDLGKDVQMGLYQIRVSLKATNTNLRSGVAKLVIL